MTRRPSKFDPKSPASGLVCPACRSSTKIVDSRPISMGYVIYRRRICCKCKHRFSTTEHIVDGAVLDWRI